MNLGLGHLDRAGAAIEFAASGDVEGRAWIADLPTLIRTMCQRWGLAVENEVAHNGYHGIVLPVRRGEEPYVLKLTWPANRAVDEARALAIWDGHGAVRMFEADLDHGAMLLERLNARQTLRDLNLTEAVAVAGRLLRRLAVPAPRGFRQLTDLVNDLAPTLDERQESLGHPVPDTWLEAARDLSQQLEDCTDNRLLIHADLHYGNILAGERESWLAIDPKPVAGDPEHAVPELLWTRVDEVEGAVGVRRLFAALIESGALDAEKARSWAIVRCVDYWLWGIEHGLTGDPKRCQRIIQALM